MNQSATPTIGPLRPGRRLRTSRAFTLIELLAVIGVIGLLAGVLIPSVARSMRMASSAVCMHNLHAVHQALQTYRIDHDGRLPDTAFDPQEISVADGTWSQLQVPPEKLLGSGMSPLVGVSSAEITQCTKVVRVSIEDGLKG